MGSFIAKSCTVIASFIPFPVFPPHCIYRFDDNKYQEPIMDWGGHIMLSVRSILILSGSDFAALPWEQPLATLLRGKLSVLTRVFFFSHLLRRQSLD